MHQRLSTTTIYVTHDQIEAMTLSDRVVVMNKGCIEQIGAPLELYDYPQSPFVAAFIGSPQMNFFDGKLDDNKSLLLSEKQKLNLGKQFAPAETEVTIGVRPEHFTLAENGWPCEVVVVEPTGLETQITARLADYTFRILLRGRTTVQPGNSIFVAVAPENIHVFLPSTNKRLDLRQFETKNS